MVRSLADRTFQPRSGVPPGGGTAAPGRERADREVPPPVLDGAAAEDDAEGAHLCFFYSELERILF